MLLAALVLGAFSDSGYLVVVAREAEAGYQRAAETLAKAHAAPLERWSGDWRELEALLETRKPTDLALVLAPQAIDANLPRRLIPLLTRFDSDPFSDCAFGVITGADGKDAQRFVDNILRAAKKPRPARTFSATSVVVDTCLRIGPTQQTRGVARKLVHDELWITGKDPKWREFVERERDLAEERGLIEWGHCGDSQGIWLFSMYRNRDEDKHWPFDPARVGRDAAGEMPRLTALDLVDGVNLFPAVVVNGSCHSGVTYNTMVGGDIVSTFGDTGGVVRFFPIKPEQSFPLMAIRHGATGYIAPLAANNANRAALEMWWIEVGGVSLGEVTKRTLDELVLGCASHALAFELFQDGAPEPADAPMFEDCASRILFGDPATVVWSDVAPTAHQVKTEKRKDGVLVVDVRWDPLASDPWVWDPWRKERLAQEQGRIYERLELPEAPSGTPVVSVVEAFAEHGGESTAVALTAFALVERDRAGKCVLHLKASGARKALDPLADPGHGPSALRAKFEVRFQGPKTGER